MRKLAALVVVLGGIATVGGLQLHHAHACDYASPRCDKGEVCAVVTPSEVRCVAMAELGHDLAPPFRDTERFFCSQGGRSAFGRTHSYSGDVFAVDLASAADDADVPIVSPIDGEAFVFDGCEERDSSARAFNDSRCGLGYGNHVKIHRGEAIYLCAHLARASAKNGRVRAGDVLGTMGCSGAAGPRHVHVVVTKSNAADDPSMILKTPGWKGSIPIRFRLAAKNMTSGARLSSWTDEFPCAAPREDALLFTR